jgi:hypothetical protein
LQQERLRRQLPQRRQVQQRQRQQERLRQQQQRVWKRAAPGARPASDPPAPVPGALGGPASRPPPGDAGGAA